jgi:hypothetical protein
MTGTAASPGASGTGRSAAPHSAAGNAFVSTAFKAKNRHLPLYIRRITLGAIHGLITSKNQSLELFTAFAAFVLENRHSLFPPEHSIFISQPNSIYNTLEPTGRQSPFTLVGMIIVSTIM